MNAPSVALGPDPNEELAFIRKVMHDSRRAAAVDATPFLVWSSVAVAGAVLEYLVRWTGGPIPIVGLWLVLIGAAWLYTLVERRRRRRTRSATTLGEQALVALWLACWIGLTVLGFVGYSSGYLAGAGIFGAFAAVLGIGMYVSGMLLGERSVRLLGGAWWVASVGLFYWRGPHALAAFALLMVMFHLVPGLILQRRWRNQTPANAPPREV